MTNFLKPFLAASLCLSAACLDQPFATNVDLPLQAIALDPSDGATDVARGAPIRVLFNLEVVEASVLAEGAVVVEDVTDAESPTPIEGEPSYAAGSGDTAPVFTYTPAGPLPYSARIRVRVTTAVLRAAVDTVPEGTLLKEVSATFATEDPPALLVVATAPAADAAEVPQDTDIRLIFSEPVRCATVEAGVSVTEIVDPDLGGGANTVAGTFSCTEPASIEETDCAGDACTVVFTPGAAFSLSSRIDVALTGGVRPDAIESFRATDLGGQLPADVTFSFQIEDPAALQLLGSSPGAGAIDVVADTSLTLVFSEDVDCASIDAAIADGTLSVTETLDDGTTVATTPTATSCAGDTVVLAFAPTFSLSSSVAVVVPASVRSVRATSRGGALTGDVLIGFDIEDPPPLRVLTTVPGNGAVSVPPDINLVAQFSEAVDCTSLDPATVIVTETLDQATAAALGVATIDHTVTVVDCAGPSVELDIAADLQLSSTMTVVLPGTVQSAIATSQGGQLEAGAGYAWSFATTDPPDLVVVFTSPGNGNVLVPDTEPVIVTFSEPVDLTSVADTSFVVERLDAGGAVVETLTIGCGTAADGAAPGTPCSYVPSAGDTTITFTPPVNLAFDNDFRVSLTSAIRSQRSTTTAGTLRVPLTWVFSTIATPPIDVIDLQPSPADTIDARPTFTVTFNQEIFAPVLDDVDPAIVDIFLAPIAASGDAPDPALRIALDCPACASVGSTFAFTPTADLPANGLFAFVIRGDLGGVRGTNGGAFLLADFTAEYVADENVLLAVTDPRDADVDIDVAAPICVRFREDIDTATVNETTFVIRALDDLGLQSPVPVDRFEFAGVDPITGAPDATFTSNQVCFFAAPKIYPCRDIDELLPADTTIDVTLSTAIVSVGGETLGSPVAYSFDTTSLPVLASTDFESIVAIGVRGDLGSAAEVPVNGTIVIDLSAAVNAVALPAGIELIDLDTGTPVAFVAAAESAGQTVRLTPAALLEFLEDQASGYELRIVAGASGLRFDDGSYLGVDAVVTFVTSPSTNVSYSPPPGEDAAQSMLGVVIFDRPMNLPSINSATLIANNDTLNQPLFAVVGTNVDDDDTATLLPVPTWPEGDAVTVSTTTGAQDFMGNPLKAPATITYPSIQSAPALAARTPAEIDASAIDVADLATVTGDQVFTISFPVPGAQLSNRMLPTTFNDATLVITDLDTCNGGGALSQINEFVIGAAGQPDIVLFSTRELLRSGCAYEVRLVQENFANFFTASAKNATDVVITVTGEAVVPTLEAAAPADAAIDVLASAALSLDFSEPMDAATFGAGAIVLDDGNGPVTGTTAVTGDIVVFTPDAPLTGGSTYTATVAGTTADLAGNAFGGDTRSFTIESTPPTVVSVTPFLNRIDVLFDEAVAAGTVGATTVSVVEIIGVERFTVPGCLDVAGSLATFTPVTPLTAGGDYEVTVTTGVTDLGGTALAADDIQTVVP